MNKLLLALFALGLGSNIGAASYLVSKMPKEYTTFVLQGFSGSDYYKQTYTVNPGEKVNIDKFVKRIGLDGLFTLSIKTKEGNTLYIYQNNSKSEDGTLVVKTKLGYNTIYTVNLKKIYPAITKHDYHFTEGIAIDFTTTFEKATGNINQEK